MFQSELTNIEFYVNNTEITENNEYIVKDGHYYPLDCLNSNQVNILFSKFTYHPETRNLCRKTFGTTNSKLMAIKAVVHSYFGELCGRKMDIDQEGNLNVEKVSADKKLKELFRNTCDIGDIEQNSLWEMQNDNLVLVDDDQYRTLNFRQWQHIFTAGN